MSCQLSYNTHTGNSSRDPNWKTMAYSDVAKGTKKSRARRTEQTAYILVTEIPLTEIAAIFETHTHTNTHGPLGLFVSNPSRLNSACYQNKEEEEEENTAIREQTKQKDITKRNQKENKQKPQLIMPQTDTKCAAGEGTTSTTTTTKLY